MLRFVVTTRWYSTGDDDVKFDREHVRDADTREAAREAESVHNETRRAALAEDGFEPCIVNCVEIHTHDCDRCVYLGTVLRRDSSDDDKIDCYYCASPTNQSLSSIIGRFGSNGPDYASSHPPEAFADPEAYLRGASRWYLFALHRAMARGLYKPLECDPQTAKAEAKT